VKYTKKCEGYGAINTGKYGNYSIKYNIHKEQLICGNMGIIP
jgi:hypothetical protein